MKRIFYLFSMALLIYACKEKPPAIPDSVVLGERKVLMEEFSGGQCVSCVAGKEEIDNFLSNDDFKDNLIVVTMHNYSFSSLGAPVPGAKYDFRLTEGDEIMNMLDKPSGLPAGYFDRTLFEGENDRALSRQQWAGFLREAIIEASSIGLSLATSFDEDSRELTINVTIVPRIDLTEDVRLTLMITENSLIDKQETPDGRVDDYVHDHVLRAVITATQGDKLLETLSKGAVIEKKYTFQLPPEEGWWVANHCNVVAFVSHFNGEDLSILQADEVHLGQ